MRTVGKCLAILVVLLVPATVFAQASLTGTVRDASGAVLPGVTVEASSPVLIEKTRSAVTDGSGQYRIVDLRPGTYTVTVTAPVLPAGVLAVIVVLFTTTTFVAAVPPNVTVPPVAKFVPVMVTPVPPDVGPLLGETLVTVGGAT